MPKRRPKPKRKSLYFPTIIISDAHLGKDTAQAGMLLEFLEHTKCDTLYMVGDIIDGWHLMANKFRPFPEMHSRVLDAINRIAHEGTKVIYIAGNHDENLRGRWSIKTKRPETLKETPKKKRNAQEKPHPILDRIHQFTDHKSGLSSSIKISNGELYQDPNGRRILLIHGDQFDWKKLKTKWGQQLSKIGDRAYDGLIKVNSYAVKLSQKYQGKNFSFANYIKKKTKASLGIIENFENAVTKVAAQGDIDGIICGHIHFAEVREINGAFYANSGDWVESASALVHDERGNWGILEWSKERTRLGLDRVPTHLDPNPNHDFRNITKKQLRWIDRLWPARNYDPVLAQMDIALASIQHSQKEWEGKVGVVMQDFIRDELDDELSAKNGDA